MRFNYIHNNPVKHGYVNEMGDWDYSSYQYYLEKYGKEWMADVLAQYPVIDFTDSGDDFKYLG
jgi:putative transposase